MERLHKQGFRSLVKMWRKPSVLSEVALRAVKWSLAASLFFLPKSWQKKWGEWRDLNPRPAGPQPAALTNWATPTIMMINLNIHRLRKISSRFLVFLYNFILTIWKKTENMPAAGSFKWEIIMSFCHKPAMRQFLLFLFFRRAFWFFIGLFFRSGLFIFIFVFIIIFSYRSLRV